MINFDNIESTLVKELGIPSNILEESANEKTVYKIKAELDQLQIRSKEVIKEIRDLL